jgi:hypothetical protein
VSSSAEPPPFGEAEIWELMNAARDRMTTVQRRLWEQVRISPQRWRQQPWGQSTNGFWAVGVIGMHVVWFNEIEEGFNLSHYTIFGTIDEYWCNQDELEHAIQRLLNAIEHGYDLGPTFGLPERLPDLSAGTP